VVGGDGKPHLVAAHRQVLDTGARRAGRQRRLDDQRDVDAAGLERVQRRRVLDHLQRKLRVGPARAQLARGTRQQAGGGGGERGDPTRARPMPAARRTSSSARREASSSSDAWRSSVSPDGVSLTPRASRSSRRVPSESSSRPMCWETAGCVNDSAAAASENERRTCDLAEGGEELEVEHYVPLCMTRQIIIGHDRDPGAP
jgi:hypothetical protein